MALLELSSRDNSRASFPSVGSPLKLSRSSVGFSMMNQVSTNGSVDRPIFEAVSKLLESHKLGEAPTYKEGRVSSASASSSSSVESYEDFGTNFNSGKKRRRRSTKTQHSAVRSNRVSGQKRGRLSKNGTFLEEGLFAPIAKSIRRDNNSPLSSSSSSSMSSLIAHRVDDESSMQTPPILVENAGVRGDTWSHSPPNMDNLVDVRTSPGRKRGRALSSPLDSQQSRHTMKGRGRRKKNNGKNGGSVKLGCKCKKTACLKLYCRCFSNKEVCHDLCACVPGQCKNTQLNDHRRLMAMQSIRNRDAQAFDSKTRRGCRCVNSSCLKKYCVCFRAKIKCRPELCQCINCKNGKGGDMIDASGSSAIRVEDKVNVSFPPRHLPSTNVWTSTSASHVRQF